MSKKIIYLSGLFILSVACAHKKPQPTTNISPESTQASSIEHNKTPDAKPVQKVTCLVNDDQRTILLDKQPQRCEVFYTKFGEKSQVAWAEATPSLCRDVLNKIKTNIESKGFKCEAHTDSQKTAKRDTASDQDH
ncbi:MAG: hypothetical protein KDD40_08980 [Bdellovibrionales bacterium]|nr:hypothetical protein [Bdellovibrionales bacterium]